MNSELNEQTLLDYEGDFVVLGDDRGEISTERFGLMDWMVNTPNSPVKINYKEFILFDPPPFDMSSEEISRLQGTHIVRRVTLEKKVIEGWPRAIYCVFVSDRRRWYVYSPGDGV